MLQGSALINWVTGTVGTALIGAAWGFYKYLQERRKDRQQRLDELQQRRTELRWRQAQAAKQLLDEMQEDTRATAALDMLDSWSRKFEIAPGKWVVITAEQWLQALRTAPDTADAEVETFVRDCFDSLFYFMAMLDHYTDRAFVRFEDAKFPLDYYVKIMAEDKAVYQAYLMGYGLTGTTDFLERFHDWTSAPSKVV